MPIARRGGSGGRAVAVIHLAHDLLHPHATTRLAVEILVHALGGIDTAKHALGRVVTVRRGLGGGGRIVGIGFHQAGRLGEESVVESYDLTRTAVVGVEGHELRMQVRHLTADVMQDAEIAAAEAVDTLLHVAHEHIVPSRCDAVDQQFLEVEPLQARSVLKLINKDVMERSAGFFEHKWRVAILHQVVEEFWSLGQKKMIVLGGDALHHICDVAQHTQSIETGEDEPSCMDDGHAVGPHFFQSKKGFSDFFTARCQFGPCLFITFLQPAMSTLIVQFIERAALHVCLHGSRRFREVSTRELPEVGTYTAVQVREVLVAFAILTCDETVGIYGRLGQLLFEALHFQSERAAQFFDIRLVQGFVDQFFVKLISLALQLSRHVAQFSSDVPGTVVADTLFDVANNPSSQAVVGVYIAQESVHGLFNHEVLIEINFEVGRKSEFVGQVGQQPLKERIDGLYAEKVVVMEQFAEGAQSFAA